MKNEFNFSKRTSWPSVGNDIMRSLDELKKQGHAILDLTESNPTRCDFNYPADKILFSLSNPKHMNYEPSPTGILEARQAVCGYYKRKKIELSPDHILLTASTSEAYAVLFRLLLNPDERVLVPAPSYPLFEFLAKLNDIQVDFYPLVYQDNWRVDLKALGAAVTSKTRAIILVNPNNPTGSFIKPPELIEMNRICRAKNIAIICDEVFLDYGFGSFSPLSLAGNAETMTFTLGGISKSLGLPQMKLGWIVANGPQEMLLESLKRLEVILDTYLSVNTPVQNALAHWLPLQEEIQHGIRARLMQNQEFIVRNLPKVGGCQYLSCEGGWYAVLRLPPTLSEESWVLEFLQQDHVFVHPGYFFDFKDEAYIVVSLLLPPETFQEGLRRVFNRIKSGIS